MLAMKVNKKQQLIDDIKKIDETIAYLDERAKQREKNQLNKNDSNRATTHRTKT